jgi:hypothetical protein
LKDIEDEEDGGTFSVAIAEALKINKTITTIEYGTRSRSLAALQSWNFYYRIVW